MNFYKCDLMKNVIIYVYLFLDFLILMIIIGKGENFIVVLRLGVYFEMIYRNGYEEVICF